MTFFFAQSSFPPSLCVTSPFFIFIHCDGGLSFFFDLLFTALVDKYDYQKWCSHFMGAIKKAWGITLTQNKSTSSEVLSTGSVLLSPFLTIVDAVMLNFRVRHGYGCLHHAIATGSQDLPWKPHTISSLVKSSAY